MRLRMAQNSLFAILLRKPWWISLMVATTLSVVAMAALPRDSALYGLSAGIPFTIISIIAAYRQLRAPSPARVSRTLEAVSAMSWREFSDAVERGFKGDGYRVVRDPAVGADFEISGSGRTVMVGCKRWKAATTGIEPLRALHSAATERGVKEMVYITIGQMTDNAWGYATEQGIHIMKEDGLAALLRNTISLKKKAP